MAYIVSDMVIQQCERDEYRSVHNFYSLFRYGGLSTPNWGIVHKFHFTVSEMKMPAVLSKRLGQGATRIR